MESIDSAIAIRKDEKVGFKDRLKKWYIEHVANNENSIDRIHDIKVNVENTAGGVVLAAYCPELLPLIPAIQKASKALKKFEYNIGKKIIHTGLGITEDEIDKKPVSKELEAIDDLALDNAVKTVGDFVVEKSGGMKR